MTNTTKLEDKATDLGKEHGYAAGSWVIDGNTTEETKLRGLQLAEDGDPEWDDLFGAQPPLSGEWADGLTPGTLMDELGVDRETVNEWDQQELCEYYERAFHDAYADEVLRMASATLSST